MRELAQETLLIACGLPASGKTWSTEITARLHGYTVIRSDLIRLEVLKGEDLFDEKVAANMRKRALVYDEMFRMADEIAARKSGLVLDATFVSARLRERAARVAAERGKAFVIQETVCPDELCLRRISERSRENYESNALTAQAFLNNKRSFEPVDVESLKALYPGLHIVHLSVDTSSDSDREWQVIGKTER
jgi:predicted kinase